MPEDAVVDLQAERAAEATLGFGEGEQDGDALSSEAEDVIRRPSIADCAPGDFECILAVEEQVPPLYAWVVQWIV